MRLKTFLRVGGTLDLVTAAALTVHIYMVPEKSTWLGWGLVAMCVVFGTWAWRMSYQPAKS